MEAKTKKKMLTGLFVLFVLTTLFTFLFANDRRRENIAFARQIAEITPRGGTPRTVEDLRRAISLYEAQINRHVRDGAQTGAFWRILGVRLADAGMHRDAVAAFEGALRFDAADPMVFYLKGISAAIVGASIVDPAGQDERERFLRLAENSHRRALELDDMYLRPMYALGVLYAFDLDSPELAIPLLVNYLSFMPNDIQAMFVLARAFVMTGEFDSALYLYGRIISSSNDAAIRRDAQMNREIVWGILDG
ncbi:MAG: tetratricopeptide repeat protein [Spirochaetes bacterium]|nr:tetratricopeptide repeat protein [Spirochaetota bacterium]